MLMYNPGDTILLYAKFNNDPKTTSFLVPAVVEVLYSKNEKIQTLLQTEMSTSDYINYYYNFEIPKNAEYGQYQVVYTGFYNGQENKLFENFYVINYQKDINPIRLYGYVYDDEKHKCIVDSNIEIINIDDNIRYISNTNLVGQWEIYLYSGNYKFIFKKNGYKTQEINARIEDNAQNVQFNNITLIPISDDNKGNGLYEIKDQYILKDGQPIENLNITIYNIADLNNALVNTYTDSDGWWYSYLDPGNYLLKVNGEFNKQTYDKAFRLQVKNNGEFQMQDMSNNVANDNTQFYPNGNGAYQYSDIVTDTNGNPIPDVQVNIIENNNIKYQYYTDLNGRFIFMLDEGVYNIEYYHPSFKTITDIITVKGQ